MGRLWQIGKGVEWLVGEKRLGGRYVHRWLGLGGLLALLGLVVGLWLWGRGEEVRRLEGHEVSVTSVTFSADSQYLISVSWDGKVVVWEVATGHEVRHFGQPEKAGTAEVALSPDGRWLVSGGTYLTIWEMATGKAVRRWQVPQTWIMSVAWSPQGQLLASGHSDGKVRLWEWSSGQLRRVLRGHRGLLYQVVFSADGRWLASASADETARLWEVASGKELRCFQGHRFPVTGVALTPDSRRLVSVSQDWTVRLWDTATGRELRQFVGHKMPLAGVALSPRGRYAVTRYEDGFAQLWDLETGKRMNKLHLSVPYWEKMHAVAISPDGRYAAIGGPALCLWRLPAAVAQESTE